MTAAAVFGNRLLRRAASRYRDAGVGPFVFATLKLRTDPVYGEIIRQGILPPEGRVLDLGCGQALALSVIRAAQDLHRTTGFPPEWPAPPRELELHGFERRSRQVRIALQALSDEAHIHAADLREATLPRCNAVMALDVLHYLAPPDQDALLEKMGRAVDDTGTIVIREVDAGAGFGFETVRASERLRSALRGQGRQSLHYRGAGEWKEAVARLGFVTTVQAMAGRFPFANVLIRGVRG